MNKNFKYILFSMLFTMVITTSCSASGWGSLFDTTPSSSQQEENSQRDVQRSATTAYPTPQVKNFLERKTISDWTKRWDVPNKPCYCYVFIGGSCLGYFVTNGKPQSYLIPETIWEDGHDLGEYSGEVQKESPDLDGCYGANNPGYRFFLANGAAVECSGAMVSMVYSDMPLSLSSVEIKTISSK